MILFEKEILAPEPTAKTHAYLYPHQDGTPPQIRRGYDRDFQPDPSYRASLPDMTCTVNSIEGSDVAIQQVGVSGFRLPLPFSTREGREQILEARVTGCVSLEAGQKGINMSRLLRTFYEHQDKPFDLDRLALILTEYRDRLGSLEARLKVDFQYPMPLPSLRSQLVGYQYYSASMQGELDRQGRLRRYLEVDFVYSSACPCSAELAEHAREVRGTFAIPHSQRSKARIKTELTPGQDLHLEELVQLARAALQTETQVLVKREDEQAFAELNGAYVKFVEDAARLLHQHLVREPRIVDFQVICSHQESLHSHDAVSVICKGIPGGFRADSMDFDRLRC